MKNSSFYKRASALCYLILIGIILSSTPALANKKLRPQLSERQQNQISGTITDGRASLPGVTIAIKNRVNYAVLSDFDGKYSLLAKANDTLVVSYIGYKTAIIPINYRKNIHIQLQEDITSLQEVRINAGYYSVKEKERTGSIARITAKDIETQPVTNVLATMQGRMAGVNITQSSGIAGSGFDIKIRGQNSLRTDGNEPLYIIDGVPYASDPIGVGYTATVMPLPTSPLNNFNPGDIESIEILKDADATAIYGSRGANGVVLLTTKKGKAGKTTFSANLQRGTAQVTRFADLMKTEQYLEMRKEAFANDGVTNYPANAYDVNGTWDPNRYTDWQKKLTGGTAQITNVQTAISGGSGLTQFLISGNYGKETTVFPGDFNYQKGNIRANLNHTSQDKRFKTNFAAGYTLQDNDQPAKNYTGESRTLAPNAPALYDEEGKLNWENGTFNNPLRNLQGKFLAKTYDLVANLGLSYQLLPSLEIKSNFGFTDLKHQESSSQPSTIYNPAWEIGPEYSLISIGNTTRQSWIIEPQLHYKQNLNEDLALDVVLGSTFQQQTARQLVQRASGFTSNSLINNLAAASDVTVDIDDNSVYKYQAFFGRVNLNWNKKYILNLTGRRDGSSRFGPGKQFAAFGAVGAAWLFSEENFFKNSVLSFGKLRASYGITGSDQIGNYQFLDTYSATGGNYQGVIGLLPTRLFNPNFAWETNRKLEVALETGVLKDRIFLTLAAFRNRSSNQLVGIPLPSTTGFTSIQANLDATVQNTGIETTLRTLNLETKNFTWSTNFNISVLRNELVSFPDLEGSTYRNQFVIGSPLNIQKMFHLEGVNPQTGLYQYKDVNGDGKITAEADQTTIVDLNPKFYGGLQNQIKYKNWQLDFLFQFVKQQNLNTAAAGFPGMLGNQAAALSDHWQKPGDIATYQRFTTGMDEDAVEAQINYYSSDGVITDASFIRLKNIALSYSLPKEWLKGAGCKIVVEGQNLLTFTHYKGADPEFLITNSLPPLKIITTAIQFNF
ncbi:SusC/RagA family TonB-linked outer membrane protein [Flavobacterium granuli]|uniref:TonB-linked SusC/RagA family outer membrane protein n=1 Tax=Flavobacterium granuli TaxID=280093 RepID=A0A1M5R462_9FLAO|nr:SusC/RagA family TonB-linked outer membrane protein [Flavobacterium granuli]PRZ21585.1 TonB-linked SusC/RagA family outer membrane protein [Flavobacterium granuli]SHH20553.1 TonB-linked outer membrane protein, SusC/RagA family [Flavobacterium granuli]